MHADLSFYLALAGVGLLLSLFGVAALLLLLGSRRRTDDALARLHDLERSHERLFQTLREELTSQRIESSSLFQQLRLEIAATTKTNAETLSRQLADGAEFTREWLDQFGRRLHADHRNESEKTEAFRAMTERAIGQWRDESRRQLEDIRRSVDDTLQGTLEKRLGESFSSVSRQLERLHQGLGEMKRLSKGVDELQKVLANVKTRGTWGEIQLGNLLEQLLAPGQYAANVAVRPDRNLRVEFAIRLPGEAGEDKPVWLPIDAKFPLDAYTKLSDAAERGDAEAVEKAKAALMSRVKASAREIRQKYVFPPHTTDFAIMYLPTEGLYAEVMRAPGLAESLQQEWRIVAAGPSTLAALLNALQMGFRTLALQERSVEVWELLAEVKSEFHRFGETLDAIRKKLGEAVRSIDQVDTRKRAIERKLKDVERTPSPTRKTE